MHSNIIYFINLGFLINVYNAKKYTNYTLFRGLPANQSHLKFFTKLCDRYDVDYWSEPRAIYESIDFVINPIHKKEMLRKASDLGIYLKIIMEDVQSMFDNQTIKHYIRSNTESMNWNNYYRLQDIYMWLADLAKEYPQEMTVQSIGKSHEDRDIMSVRLAMNGSSYRSVIIIEGGIHAREWISPAVVTYLIDKIVHSSFSVDDSLKYIAHTYEWYFVPVLNPDGYEYSHKVDRLWRKNRNRDGVDLNRNFDAAFGTVGADKTPVHNTYCGAHAFSEKESQAMSRLVDRLGHRLEYYINFHSYGQYMIIPYAHTDQHLDNYMEVYLMCKEAADKIFAQYNTVYKIGTAHDTVGYKTSGASTCWVKMKHRVPYVVTFELRDQGSYGFGLPTDQILPTCQEILDGLVSLFTPRQVYVRRLKHLSSSEQANRSKPDPFYIILIVLLSIIICFY